MMRIGLQLSNPFFLFAELICRVLQTKRNYGRKIKKSFDRRICKSVTVRIFEL